jgi:uncharacterized protein YndB with AHSA1/START domain
MTTLPHTLDRTILIHAAEDVVFRYFTDSARWAAWWGAGSTIDARPGGAVFIRYPNGVEVSGEVVESTPPARIVFTYGYASGAPIGPGASLVTIRLEPVAQGTRVHLTHAFAEAAVRDHHVQGWRYQLSLFANVVSDETHQGVGALVDRWFAAWADRDASSRDATLAAIASPDIQMRDRFSCVDGLDELSAHIAGAQRFMPGVRLQATGAPRHCQGTVIADWTAIGPGGQPQGSGTNVFVLDTGGRISSVTGFWSQ